MKRLKPILINGTTPAAWDGYKRPCKACGRLIGFARSQAGRPMPFDVGDKDHTSHYATCTNPNAFRRHPGESID